MVENIRFKCHRKLVKKTVDPCAMKFGGDVGYIKGDAYSLVRSVGNEARYEN